MEAARLRSDMISNLPSSVIEIILSFLPFKQAVRTSILSQEWKHHWTNHPKLEFALKFSSLAKRKLYKAVNKVMSVRRGTIHDFSLSMRVDGTCVKVDHIIDNLSRNNATLSKLAIDMVGYCLPKSLFSLHNLTDLYLHRCRLDVPPTFSGFGSLTNLYMENVVIANEMLLLFLSGCPSLKTVVLNTDIVRALANDHDPTTIVELFECLSMIENLFICLPMLKDFARGRVPNELPVALVHLKYLCISDMFRVSDYKCYAFLIRSSPNLEKLKLKLSFDTPSFLTDNMEDYSDMWLERLNELEIEFRPPGKRKLDFVKLIIANSPMLKKVRIFYSEHVSKDEEDKIISFLLQPPIASKVVEIIFKSGGMFGMYDCRPFKPTKDW